MEDKWLDDEDDWGTNDNDDGNGNTDNFNTFNSPSKKISILDNVPKSVRENITGGNLNNINANSPATINSVVCKMERQLNLNKVSINSFFLIQELICLPKIIL